MTGRELIIYILRNGLENEKILNNGRLLGLVTIEEAAEEFEVGVATIKAWIQMKQLSAINMDGKTYLFMNKNFLTGEKKNEQ